MEDVPEVTNVPLPMIMRVPRKEKEDKDKGARRRIKERVKEKAKTKERIVEGPIHEIAVQTAGRNRRGESLLQERKISLRASRG